MPNPLAVAHARKILEDFCFNYPGQYNLKQIINARGLTYREAPLAGSIGNIIFDGKGGSVTVSSNLNDTAQKNFTAAHELGHFENEREALTPPGIPFIKWEEKNREEDEKALFPSERGVRICKYEDIMSIKKNINYEMNANDFAAELLMHEPWFVEKVKGKKLTAELLKETAAYFQVSLTAAAIRYAEIGTHPAAIVMSKDGVVKVSPTNLLNGVKKLILFLTSMIFLKGNLTRLTVKMFRLKPGLKVLSTLKKMNG